MRYFLLLCLFFFYTIPGFSQEKHFILIQSETRQLFNVNLNGKMYSANSSGFVIIPKLSPGDYYLIIGFPENTFPDQAFKCSIAKRDVGFNLQNMGQEGWALLDLQTRDLTNAEKEAPVQVSIPKTKVSSGDEPISFNQPKQTPTPTPTQTQPGNPVKTENPPLSVKTDQTLPPFLDTSLNVKSVPEIPSNPIKDSSVVNATALHIDSVLPLAQNSIITKLAETKSAEGLSLLFSDSNNANSDTIVAFIDAESQPAPEQQATAKAIEDSVAAERIKMLNSRKDDVKVLEIDMSSATKDSSKNVTVEGNLSLPPDAKIAGGEVMKEKTSDNNTVASPAAESKIETPKSPEKSALTDSLIAGKSESDKIVEKDVVNAKRGVAENNQVDATNNVINPTKTPVKSGSFCNSVGDESDYLKLRRKMALESSDDKMIKEAKKVFKEKCFTTLQMKGLSTLFLSDEGRFHFFSAAYSFVSDPEMYSTLQSEFIDPYYINRFKSIIQ